MRDDGAAAPITIVAPGRSHPTAVERSHDARRHATGDEDPGTTGAECPPAVDRAMYGSPRRVIPLLHERTRRPAEGAQMLSSKEQAKNGFGAFFEREQERHVARQAELARRAQADGDAGSPRAPAATTGQPDGPADMADGRSR
jgi:hypothetical protein